MCRFENACTCVQLCNVLECALAHHGVYGGLDKSALRKLVGKNRVT